MTNLSLGLMWLGFLIYCCLGGIDEVDRIRHYPYLLGLLSFNFFVDFFIDCIRWKSQD